MWWWIRCGITIYTQEGGGCPYFNVPSSFGESSSTTFSIGLPKPFDVDFSFSEYNLLDDWECVTNSRSEWSRRCVLKGEERDRLNASTATNAAARRKETKETNLMRNIRNPPNLLHLSTNLWLEITERRAGVGAGEGWVLTPRLKTRTQSHTIL